VIEGDEIHEHVGIFKEYSSDFLHLLDVEFPEPWTLDLAAARPTEHAGMAAAWEGDVLKVSNRGARPVLVVAVDAGGGERSVDALVAPGGTIDGPLAATGDKERLRLRLEQAPADATAAAALGALLLKRQDHAEAGRWLRAAYNGRDTLPDGGRRVLMQLRELSRRLAQRGHEGAGERALHES
jgi:hypothetical protein